MKNKILFYIAIISVLSISMYSQEARVAKAEKKYDNYAYVDAIKTYEKLANKGYKSADMFKKLGNAYYFNAELEDAAKWYTELFTMEAEIEPEYYYRYAQTLRSIGENKKADEIMVKFNAFAQNDDRGKLFMENRDYLSEIKANSGRYDIEPTSLSTPYSDYGTAIYLNKLVYASAKDTGSIQQRKHSWNNQYFTDLYTAELGDEMVVGKTAKFDKLVNTRFHESTAAFTKDGKTMYFTRNNFNKDKKGFDGNNITLIKIYKATFEDNKWINITELSINSDNYSNAHPALSPDEKTLYFASDMPGTVGLSDIFKVAINEDGSLGNPVNLGNLINTAGRETFPYTSADNELYFSSNGHPGLGGLDVFVSKINSEGNFNKVQNVGADINSPLDDFAYMIDSKSRRGFFSSNKDGGQGLDDIYRFLETRRLTCEQELFGKITDIETHEVLSDTKITVFDNMFNELGTTQSDKDGNYSLIVECDMKLYVRAEKMDYTTKEVKATTLDENGKTELNIELEKARCKVVVGDDLGKCFGITNIYFDFDKSDIRYEAAIDLEKILDVLIEYPAMKLDIRSHTDSRGSSKYNEALSDRRAKSTINWLIKNGVAKDRLTAKGYGEYKLINKCIDGVECTEKEHQLNRRSEFIITDL
ncbi:OmpA family protein [Flavobacterium hiemivividum]|uniref:Flagellar motor protein MotB n=1 Tax=Flavobacterium hiemivividum TaxID=2541734 RepID=A0A4V6PFF6_9FLAO|nr:OmpA family protein [Flavobacterium hiemivividum]TDE02608.1 flagellar motor protein MotB [Flavobacterium hiemivividum]